MNDDKKTPAAGTVRGMTSGARCLEYYKSLSDPLAAAETYDLKARYCTLLAEGLRTLLALEETIEKFEKILEEGEPDDLKP